MTEIKKLADDALISEPGFYEMSLEKHHSQPCVGPSVTSSVLRTMELHSPADVWAFSKLNPKRFQREETSALRTGRAMAFLVEGGEEMLRDYAIVLPVDKPNRPTALQIENAKNGKLTPAAAKSIRFWQEMDADPRVKVSQAEWETLVAMGAVLANDPAAAAALGGIPEVTMAWQDDRTGIWCLARPDQLSLSGLLSDYKKTSGRGYAFNTTTCDRAITNYGYDMQMAFADTGFRVLTGEAPDQIGLVFQLDTPPYHVILRGIDEEDIELARFRNDRSLYRFAECLESGNWPGPGEHVGNYRRPDWQRERLLEDMNTANV